MTVCRSLSRGRSRDLGVMRDLNSFPSGYNFGWMVRGTCLNLNGDRMFFTAVSNVAGYMELKEVVWSVE